MKKLISVISAVLIIACMLCSLTVSAATVTAKFGGPDEVYAKDELKLQLVVEGDGVKGVTGTVTYDYSILEFTEATVDATGWKIRVNSVENQLFFSAVDAENNNPVNGKAIFTVKFSTEYSLKGDKVLVTGTELKASSGNGTVSLSDVSYEKTVTDKPIAQNPENNNSQPTVSEPEKEASKDKDAETDNSEDSYDYDDETEGDEEGDPLDDIRLKSLEIENVDVELNFEPDTKSYNINVPADTKELIIKAVPMNPASTVTITDNELTYPVKNITKIVVEAENGSRRTYKIYSMKDIDSQNTDGASKGGLALWQWIAIIVGSIALAAVVFIIVLLILKRRKKNN